MANVTVSTANGFDSRHFWVQNTGQSTNERFETQTSAHGNVLLGTRVETYESVLFKSDGRTYTYGGEWTVRGENGALTSSLAAGGFYDTIAVEIGGSTAANISGLDFGVDFGSRSGLRLLNVLEDIVDLVRLVLFGPPNEMYANLHRGATPNIVSLAYAGDDFIGGNIGDDSLFGFGGNDMISGNDGSDVLRGGRGNDTLTGGLGQDILHGQGDADTFVYDFATESGTTADTADRILRFRLGTDRIDLGGIDADLTRVGDQAFEFIGLSKFTGEAGQLRIRLTTADTTLIGADLDGDGGADFMIVLTEPMTPSASDFIL